MNYWQIKAAALERTIRIKEADEAFARVMAANGLDPNKHYHLKDDDESVTEVPTNGPPA